MNKNKKYIIIVSLVLIILIASFFYWNLDKEKELLNVYHNEQVQTQDDLNENKQIETLIKENKKKENIEITEDITTIKVSLTVSGKRYETNIKEGASAFEVMEKIQKESTSDNIFYFKYTNNASMGNFITEINGDKGTPGKYWIYYVNNKKPSVGVSNYILKEGDIINWSQEGI